MKRVVALAILMLLVASPAQANGQEFLEDFLRVQSAAEAEHPDDFAARTDRVLDVALAMEVPAACQPTYGRIVGYYLAAAEAASRAVGASQREQDNLVAAVQQLEGVALVDGNDPWFLACSGSE